MKIYLMILFCFFLQAAFAQEIQDIYKYKNKDGSVEFTDQVKPDASPKKHLQIKRSSEEENALREKKLELIRAKDKELDQRLAIERKKKQQQELALKKQKEKNRAEQLRQQQAEQQQDQYYYGNPYWQVPYPPLRPLPPHHPGRPGLPPHRPDNPKVPVQLPTGR